MKLKGKVGIVTGASSGIGRAIAIAMAKAEMKVVCAARRLDALNETVSLIADITGLDLK